MVREYKSSFPVPATKYSLAGGEPRIITGSAKAQSCACLSGLRSAQSRGVISDGAKTGAASFASLDATDG
jgi:uncharacterized protein (UPF0303 family)